MSLPHLCEWLLFYILGNGDESIVTTSELTKWTQQRRISTYWSDVYYVHTFVERTETRCAFFVCHWPMVTTLRAHCIIFFPSVKFQNGYMD